MDERVEFQVAKRFTDPKRLDQYLVARFPEMSRSMVKKLIEGGELLLNGRPAKGSHKVRFGDHVIFHPPAEVIKEPPPPQDIPLHVVYEDDHLVIINKPADMIVHPGRGVENKDGTLVNALQFHFDSLSTLGGDVRPGIVHRLDRDTTGIIVVAKNDLVHSKLGIQFENRKVVKEYEALCYNNIDRDRDYIDRPIGKHPTVREKMAIRDDPAHGKPAVTFFEIAERFDGFCYVKLRPRSGRTHQLRVHLEHIGLPIVADKAYSGRSRLCVHDLDDSISSENDEPAELIGRQALHARRLRFFHPARKEMMTFEAPLPDDMARTLDALRQYKSNT